MQSVNLNLIPGAVMPVVNVSQYDAGRQFSISVYEGASSYSLTGKTVEIRGTKPDGNGFAYDDQDGVVSVAGSTVTITTTQQMTAVGGNTTAELRITSGTTIIGTLNFILAVENSALSDDTPISDTEIPAIERQLEELVEEIQVYTEDAEAWAAGTRDGQPVPSSDPAYENNSKYYAEDAGASATTATTKAGEAATSATAASGSATAANADALKSEGYAVGEQNGVPVSSGSPYYNYNAKFYAQAANHDAGAAGTSANNAAVLEASARTQALKSEGFAVGEQNGTPVGSDSPYYQNNAKYWRDQAAQYAAGGLHFVGSVAFANIPTTGMVNGDLYNITDDFTTDSRFVDGAGIPCKAGTDIAWVDSVSKWDLLNTGGGSTTLYDLADTQISYPSSGSPLVYNATVQKWVNGAEIPYNLSQLSDTTITTPTDGEVLKYDSGTNKWVNGTGGGGGADVPLSVDANGRVCITYETT